jgi:hypothetical protein
MKKEPDSLSFVGLRTRQQRHKQRGMLHLAHRLRWRIMNPHHIRLFQEMLTTCVQTYIIPVVQMASRNKSRIARQKPSGPVQGATNRSKTLGTGPDRLGESRRAVSMILASWALQELIAQRASEGTHG